MIHARKDYMHIQDKTGHIEKDEPVFLLRAKDMLAPDTVMHWANMLFQQNGDMVAYRAAMKQADLMSEWQSKNTSKLPDTPPEAV